MKLKILRIISTIQHKISITISFTYQISMSKNNLYIQALVIFMVRGIFNFIDRPNWTRWFRHNQWLDRADFYCPHFYLAKFSKILIIPKFYTDIRILWIFRLIKAQIQTQLSKNWFVILLDPDNIWKMQNKFRHNDTFLFLLVSACYISLYSVDIKFKSVFWPTRNKTEKIEFVSRVSQIFGP